MSGVTRGVKSWTLCGVFGGALCGVLHGTFCAALCRTFCWALCGTLCTGASRALCWTLRCVGYVCTMCPDDTATQRSPTIISMIVYHFLGIFDITISLFWAMILSDSISILNLSYHFLTNFLKNMLYLISLASIFEKTFPK
jgi:hypothetical protein